jgi:hypothetical protein
MFNLIFLFSEGESQIKNETSTSNESKLNELQKYKKEILDLRKLTEKEKLFFEYVKKNNYIDVRFALFSNPDYIYLKNQVEKIKKKKNVFLIYL